MNDSGILTSRRFKSPSAFLIPMASNVWFGVHVPPEGRDFEEMKKLCTGAERLGYDLFTVTDHFMNMANPNGPGNHPLECWTTLAGLAAVTNRIRLGPLVGCYAYRRPTVLTKMATTVDIVSGGRLVFGIGAGWHEAEFNGFLGRFPPAGTRLRGLEEAVEICKGMFTSERTTYTGKQFKVEDVLNSPLPVQRPPPIMVGGGGERRTLKIAARHADISHFFAGDLPTLEQKLRVLRKHCETVNRDFDGIRKGTSASVILGRNDGETESKLRKAAKARGVPVEDLRKRMGPAFGTPEKVTQNLEAYIDKGVGLITLSFYDVEDMALFAEEIIPRLK